MKNHRQVEGITLSKLAVQIGEAIIVLLLFAPIITIELWVIWLIWRWVF